MHIFRPCKRAIVFGLFVLYIVNFFITYAIGILDKYLPTEIIYILVAADVVFMLIMHAYFIVYKVRSRFEILENEIHIKSGVLIFTDTYLPVRSVMSVTNVTTPLSMLTGLNFVIFNALGAKAVIMFVRRRDAIEISRLVNNSISERQKQVQKDD